MSELKQIVVTDHNDNEGEDFSFILNVTDEQLLNIVNGIDEDEPQYSIKEGTNYTKEDVIKINDLSSNSYMDFINFYEFLPLPKGEIDWYYDIFYKGGGLKKIE